jgi:glycosyltransferase involved in cell wall biosynthesis
MYCWREASQSQFNYGINLWADSSRAIGADSILECGRGHKETSAELAFAMNKRLENFAPPLVSVCIPTYNRRAQLEQTLATIRNQTYQNYEVIVCDDCSTDGTYEFLSSLHWPCLTVLRNEKNLNLPGSLTRLLSHAQGKYIGMQHDHDLYAPDFLAKMVALMESHPSAGFGCCGYHKIDDDGYVTLDPSIEEYSLFPLDGLLPGYVLVKILATKIHTPIPAMGTIFRRTVVEQAGGYRPDWWIASDEDLYCRVAAISDVALCRDRLFSMRFRPPERHHVLGGWKSIYTLYEFRTNVTNNYYKAGYWAKLKNLFKLRVLRDNALWRESVYLWLRGDKQHLNEALQFSAIPTLPTRRPFLNLVEKACLELLLSTLNATNQLGARLGEYRSKRKFRQQEFRVTKDEA